MQGNHRTMSQVEEEMMYGVKLPRMRGGRLPALYRSEVDAIMIDRRPITEIALSWGVSVNTINRVKQKGKYRGVPYIPRDEVHRDYPTNMIDHIKSPRSKGRPFKSGRGELDIAEIAEIVTDRRPVHEIARAHELTVSYVMKLKRELSRAEDLGDRLVTLRGKILADQREHAAIAVAYKVPVHIVEQIKNEQVNEA